MTRRWRGACGATSSTSLRRPYSTRAAEAARRTRGFGAEQGLAVDGLFDDTEPDDESQVLDDAAPIEESSSFRRYVSEGIALLEDWLRDPD